MKTRAGSRVRKPELVEELRSRGVIAAVRLRDPRRLPQAVAALAEGGIRAVDLAYGPARGGRLMQTLRRGGLLVGIGAITRAAEAREAGMLGADFIVAAATAPDVVSACREMGLPCVLSGVTPTEVWRAHEMGADFVKVESAAGLGGPRYIRSLCEAVPARRLIGAEMPLEGYTPYLEEGIEVLEFKSSLDIPELAEEERWSEISRRASLVVQAIEDWKSSHDRHE
jgi:2-dehydro-3-deoxyphosphogluconate aldolase/(4S)-4-hydroxy-2-oxoglutarate aldolase